MRLFGSTITRKLKRTEIATAPLLVAATIAAVIWFLGMPAAKPFDAQMHQINASVVAHYLPALEFANSSDASTLDNQTKNRIETVSTHLANDPLLPAAPSFLYKINDNGSDNVSL